MSTIKATGVFTADYLVDDTNTPLIVLTPGNIRDLYLTAKSSAAGANNVDYTVSSPADIQAGTADWVAVTALQNVGTTRAEAALVDSGNNPIPATALRVTRAAGNFEFGIRGFFTR